MTVQSFTFNPFQTNCYICHDAGEAMLVDPSCHTHAERTVVLDYLDRHALTMRHLVLTHGHIDHIFGCAFFAERFGLSWQMHRADLQFLEYASEQAAFFGVPMETPPPRPGRFLAEEDVIALGTTAWQVLHTPGHSPGSVCLYDAADGVVVAGDVLFMGSIGRTDLPGGSLPDLMRSIEEKLLVLDDETTVYPGHGPATTIGRERHTNPFLTSTFPFG